MNALAVLTPSMAHLLSVIGIGLLAWAALGVLVLVCLHGARRRQTPKVEANDEVLITVEISKAASEN